MFRCIAAAALLLASPALASPPPVGSDDWNVMHPYSGWVTTQHDGLGRWCCDLGDGRPVDARVTGMDAEKTPPCEGAFPTRGCGVDIPGGEHWIAHVTPEHFPGERDRWMAVPDEKVTHNVNPTGLPILWLYQGRVQCFAPPDGV